MYNKEDFIRIIFLIITLVLFVFFFSKYSNIVVDEKEYFSPLNPIAIFYEFILLFLIGFVIAQFISHRKIRSKRSYFIKEIEEDIGKELKILGKKIKKLF